MGLCHFHHWSCPEAASPFNTVPVQESLLLPMSLHMGLSGPAQLAPLTGRIFPGYSEFQRHSTAALVSCCQSRGSPASPSTGVGSASIPQWVCPQPGGGQLGAALGWGPSPPQSPTEKIWAAWPGTGALSSSSGHHGVLLPIPARAGGALLAGVMESKVWELRLGDGFGSHEAWEIKANTFDSCFCQ